jgi:hypothetical protein
MTDWLILVLWWVAGMGTGFGIGRVYGGREERKFLAPMITYLSKAWDEGTQRLVEKVVR